MIPQSALRSAVLISLSTSLLFTPVLADEPTEFLEVLRLADLDPNNWPDVNSEQLDEPAQELLRQLLYRLGEFSQQQLAAWAVVDPAAARRGDLLTIAGTVADVEPIFESNGISSHSDVEQLYLCRYQSDAGNQSGYVISPQIPSPWNDETVTNEPVRFVGIVLNSSNSDTPGPLLLTDHLSWYPTAGVSSGRLLLSNEGMDVSLLDEVRHHQPFVKPSISREGEAFYACLAAISRVDGAELADLTLQNVEACAKRSAAEIPALETSLKELKTDPNASQQFVESTRRKLALATAVKKRAERQVSSVAPLFLQPEQETGELVRIEGVARRVVRVVADRETPDAYYEMEVFPSDSQNLPIVCCVTRLPRGFPEGDKIRESVRVDGLFFKSWRFRTRKNLADTGKTARPQQLYTPVIVGQEPIWLKTETGQSSSWAIAAGVGVLAVIAIALIWQLRSSREERRNLAARNPSELPGTLAGPTPDNDAN